VQAGKITISKEAEEYLEAIYRLQKKTGSARTMELARQLRVVPGSVTNTIESLEKRGFVTHEPYKGVSLTEKGRRIALSILKRHRLAERLLTDILHLDWSEVHDAACKLEHALEPEVTESLEKTLGHPKTCPHGNPIPTSSGRADEERSVPLVNLQPGESCIVTRIVKEKSKVLRHLSVIGLTVGVRVEVQQKSSFGSPLIIQIGAFNYPLDYEIALIVEVKRVDEK
jgi:DtxR family Mn-dependent transcriptional regulator